MSSFGDHRALRRSKKWAGAAGAPLQRQGNGIPAWTRTWQPGVLGSALAVQRGRMGCLAAQRPGDTRQLLVFVVAGPVYPGRSSRDSVAASRFVTTHNRALRNVFAARYPAHLPRPWGRPHIQRLLQGYAVLTEPRKTDLHPVPPGPQRAAALR
jgi:hypothetical protein